MKNLKYNSCKGYLVLYFALTVVAYLKCDRVLNFLSGMAIITIASLSVDFAKRFKIKIDVNSVINNEKEFKPVNIMPLLIISAILFFLGLLQVQGLFHFNKTNNLVITLIMIISSFYLIEKGHKIDLKYEELKKESISKIGKEEFERREKEHEEFFEKLEKDFKNDSTKK